MLMGEIRTSIEYFCDETNTHLQSRVVCSNDHLHECCSTTSIGGIIKTKRSAVVTHRSGDQDIGAGVAQAEKSTWTCNERKKLGSC